MIQAEIQPGICNLRTTVVADCPDGMTLLKLDRPAVAGVRGNAVFAVVQFEYVSRDAGGRRLDARLAQCLRPLDAHAPERLGGPCVGDGAHVLPDAIDIIDRNCDRGLNIQSQPIKGPAGVDRAIFQEAAEIVGQVSGRGVAIGRIAGGGLRHDRFQIAGDVAIESARAGWIVLQNLLQQHLQIAAKGTFAGE